MNFPDKLPDEAYALAALWLPDADRPITAWVRNAGILTPAEYSDWLDIPLAGVWPGTASWQLQLLAEVAYIVINRAPQPVVSDDGE